MRSEPGTVAVAGADQQVGTVGGADHLTFDAAVGLEPVGGAAEPPGGLVQGRRPRMQHEGMVTATGSPLRRSITGGSPESLRRVAKQLHRLRTAPAGAMSVRRPPRRLSPGRGR